VFWGCLTSPADCWRGLFRIVKNAFCKISHFLAKNLLHFPGALLEHEPQVLFSESGIFNIFRLGDSFLTAKFAESVEIVSE
jgi:hypothetical protein